MQLITLTVSPLNTNCYLLHDTRTRDCVVIDPGGNLTKILNALDENNLNLKAILLTHTHFDHFGAMWPLRDRRPVPVFVNKLDLAPIVNTGPQRFVPPPDTHFIEDGDILNIGSISLKVIACPGHTPGGVAYLCEDMLFTGDTLFHLSCGSWRFPGGNSEELLNSLQKIKNLPGDYRIYPGHLESSFLSVERVENPFLQDNIVFRDSDEDELD